MINYVLALMKLLNWIQSIKKLGLTKELHLRIKVNIKMHWTGNFFDNYLCISFDEAIKLDPKDKEAWYNKGNAFYDLKKY